MAKNEASLLIRIKQEGAEVLETMGKGALALGAAFIGLGVSAVSAFKESEAATNELNQAMVNQGVFTTQLAKNYQEMASALSKSTTFADEQITSAQATLQAFAGQTQITKELTQATLDFATAKKVDLKTAAEVIGKTIGTETNALGRYGIEVDATASKQEKLAQVIESLNGKFGGQAEAAAKGLGTLDQLKNSASEVLEALGGRLAPYIGLFTKQLITLTDAIGGSDTALDAFEFSINVVAKSVVGLKNLVLGLGEVIGTGLAVAFESVSLATQGEFTKAKEMAATGMDELKAVIAERKATTDAEFAAIDEAKFQADELKRQEEVALIAQSEANKTAVKKAELDKQLKNQELQKQKQFKIEQEKVQAENQWAQAKANIASSSANLIAALSKEGSKAAFLAQKAAGIAQAIVATNVAEAQALAVPPAPNIGLAQLARTSGYINIAAIAATAIKGLATGGIVSATNGGTPFILGEGGRDEAVIPLDDPDAQSRIGGGGVTINFMGPILGDESQAMEFARAIDKSLLKLRQTNQSVAFETDVF